MEVLQLFQNLAFSAKIWAPKSNLTKIWTFLANPSKILIIFLGGPYWGATARAKVGQFFTWEEIVLGEVFKAGGSEKRAWEQIVHDLSSKNGPIFSRGQNRDNTKEN